MDQSQEDLTMLPPFSPDLVNKYQDSASAVQLGREGVVSQMVTLRCLPQLELCCKSELVEVGYLNIWRLDQNRG